MTLVQKEIKAVYTWTGNITDMRGPCPEGYHVPSSSEGTSLLTMLTNLGVSNPVGTYLKMPSDGYLRRTTPSVSGDGYGSYWCSDLQSTGRGYYIQIRAGGKSVSNQPISVGQHIRPFKDIAVIPTASWTKLYSGTGDAGIYHDTVSGLISISDDGTNWITIADKNLGATDVWSNGDSYSESKCGKWYQWGNNYGFSYTGPWTTSSTQVNASTYGPSNYYSSSTFVNGAYNRDSSNNTNLRGGVTGPLTEHKIRPSQILRLIQNSSLYKSTNTAYTDTQGCWISPDGTKLFMGYWGSSAVMVKYNLSTPFDVTSKGSVVQTMSAPYNGGIWFNNDGTILFLANSNNGSGGGIKKYTLSTAWDLSTASNTQSYTQYRCTSIFLGDSGKKIYFTDYSDASRRQATLTTAYNLSTMQTPTTVNISGMYRGISFSTDGKYVFLNNSNGGDSYGTIYQYELATPRDLTSTKTQVSTYTASGGEGCCFWMSDDMQYWTWSVGASSSSNISIYKVS